MDLKLDGRIALVTGAGSGIGAGIASVLAQQGARVIVTGRRSGHLEETAERIARTGARRPIVVPMDITDAGAPTLLVEAAHRELGGAVDILVNNAGGSRPMQDIGTGEDWDNAWLEAFALNFTAARRTTEAVLPTMRARRWGRIVNISGSMEPRTLNAAIAAKAALHLWAKGLSCDVAADGVTINTIPPGRIDSEQVRSRLHPSVEARAEFAARHIPAGYFGEPEDIGHLVAFLASPLARYITGAVIPVDGGMHHFAH